MIDHAQAKIMLLDSAAKVADQFSDSDLALVSYHSRLLIMNLRKAAADFRSTHQPKREDDDFDSLHGCG